VLEPPTARSTFTQSRANFSAITARGPGREVLLNWDFKPGAPLAALSVQPGTDKTLLALAPPIKLATQSQPAERFVAGWRAGADRESHL
jgi:hypothetical protein